MLDWAKAFDKIDHEKLFESLARLNMPEKYIHAPWLTPAEVLAAAGVQVGHNYPAPIMDIKESRERALAAFAVTKIQPTEA